MPGSVAWIEPVREVVTPEKYGSDHPIRAVTNDLARGREWSPALASTMAENFDRLSAGWHVSHTNDLRLAPLDDVLERGDLGSGRLVELGSGTGAGTERIASRRVVHAAVDLSAGMLTRADPSLAPRVQADGSCLPFPDGAIDILVFVNMLLFPREVDRVLAPVGRIVWVNTLGDETPIHLPPEKVVEALPGPWEAVASEAGTGFWAVVRRA